MGHGNRLKLGLLTTYVVEGIVTVNSAYAVFVVVS